MPLNEGDVLDALSDAINLNMDFWVDTVHISSKAYGIIRDHIRAENILVVPGTDSLAFYDSKTDILTTQAGNSPANMHQRALLLHECTHALVDIFTNGTKFTRHADELASYLAQFTYMIRSDPAWVPGPNPSAPWAAFFSSVVALIQRFRLDTAAGNGSKIGVGDLEPLRVQLAALPGVNYGSFKKEDPTGADGLTKTHFFIDSHEDFTVHRTISHETYPDPSDDYLAATLQEQYSASDVAGYGKRLRSLRKAFALCSLGRARALIPRLSARSRGDRVSELFHDRLSTAGRAILLRVLRKRA